MAPMIALHHVAFALAAAALGGAGLRVAGALGARGLELVLAAAPIAAAAAVLWALLLGLVELGGSPVALVAGAVLTWVAARTLLPDPAPRRRLAAWWTHTTPAARATVAGAVAAGVALTFWQLRHPYISLDGLTYHLALPAAWLHEGSPGAVVALFQGVPVGSYPLTHEVLVGWGLGITRSWVVASVITPLLVALMAVATWSGLRSLAVPRRVAGLSAGALLTLPLVTSQYGAPLTDIAALAWLAVTAALVAQSLRGPRPLLLAPALVSAGLAIGTKTTPALLTLLVLGYGLWCHRGALRPHARPLGAAAVLALFVCAIWPIRNLVDHGSPLWPFLSTPWGDPRPPLFSEFGDSFIHHPATMLSGRWGAYAYALAGALVLVPAALLLPLARRSRAAIVVGAASALAVVMWMFAPYTGADRYPELAVTATRYLLPALMAAIAAIALSSRGCGPGLRRVIEASLVAAIVISLAYDLKLGYPYLPAAATLLFAAALGGGVAWLAGTRVRSVPAWTAPALAVLTGLVLAGSAPGYIDRHTATFTSLDGYAALMNTLASRPGYDDDERPVSMAPATTALAGGPRLRHPVTFVPGDEPCPAVRARARRGWLVLGGDNVLFDSARLRGCMRGRTPILREGSYRLYGPG